MTYASLDDLLARGGEAELLDIADRDRDGIPDADVISAALVHADNLIDGYIGAKYGPLIAVPDLVRSWATAIARYILHSNGAPDHIQADYKDAVAALKDVAKGLIALPVPAGATPPADLGGGVKGAHPAPVFTAEKLRGW